MKKLIVMVVLWIAVLPLFSQSIEPTEPNKLEFEAKVLEGGLVVGYGKVSPDFTAHQMLAQILKNQQVIIAKLDSIIDYQKQPLKWDMEFYMPDYLDLKLPDSISIITAPYKLPDEEN